MTVEQLIQRLRKMPPHLEVRVWDEEQDEDVPIVTVLYEDGTSHVSLLSFDVGPTIDALPDEDASDDSLTPS